MTLEPGKPAPLTYDHWKLQLRRDCELKGKLFAFDGLGEYTLRLLWGDGLDPTVDAIVRNTGTPKAS